MSSSSLCIYMELALDFDRPRLLQKSSADLQDHPTGLIYCQHAMGVLIDLGERSLGQDWLQPQRVSMNT